MTQLDEQTLTLLAQHQHGVFAAHQADGLTRSLCDHRVQQARWRRHRSGIYVIAGSPDTWEQRLWLALLAAGDGAAVARRSAARLHRLPGSWTDHLDLVQPECSVPRDKPQTSRRSSFIPATHVSEVNGFPTTTVARTLFDLGGLTGQQRRRRGWAYLPAPRVERIVDDALAHKRVTVAQLGGVLIDLGRRGRPGTALMRELLEVRGPSHIPTESELEDLFLRLVRAHGLPEPRRQVSLGDDEGVIARVDFVFDDAKLIVELDGRRYHEPRAVVSEDLRRDLRLTALGWQVIRLDWWQLIRAGSDIARDLSRVLAPAA